MLYLTNYITSPRFIKLTERNMKIRVQNVALILDTEHDLKL
jgi:hypothetical protein